MTQDIDRIVARFGAPPVSGVSDGARELMREIMASDPTPEPAKTSRRRPPLRLAIPVGALLAAGAVAATWFLPASPAAALDIKEENGYYLIEVKDLYANPKVYEDQLKALNLDVTLRLEPATAAFEGQVFPVAPDMEYITEIKGIYPPGPCDKLDGCAIGVKIPVGYQGTADVTIGRKANPGEEFQATTSWDTKGEPMQCVPFVNKTVGELRTVLEQRGIAIKEFLVQDPENPGEDFQMKASVPDSFYVYSGLLKEPGKAVVMVNKLPVPPEYENAAEYRCKSPDLPGLDQS